MMLLPVALRVEDAQVLVVGGGAVAARKVRSLLECGARVRLVSPQLCDELKKREASLEYSARHFEQADCDGCLLVFACTNDAEVNAKIAAAAKAKNIWCHIADDARGSTLHSAATVRRDEICIGITTGGGSPALAKHLKKEVEECVGEEYSALLELMSARREDLKSNIENQSERAAIWREILSSGVLQLLREGKTETAEAIIENKIGLTEP